MQSKKSPELVDLERDIPTTSEDIAALDAVRRLDRMNAREYLEFLLAFSERHPPSRSIPPRHEPFEL